MPKIKYFFINVNLFGKRLNLEGIKILIVCLVRITGGKFLTPMVFDWTSMVPEVGIEPTRGGSPAGF